MSRNEAQGISRREEHARETRAALLATARDVFATKGYAATSIDDIAAQARLTKGAFYHRFKGTDGYRDALLERWHAVTTDHVIDRLAPAAASDDPDLRRDALNVLVVNIDLALERSIRSWGVYDAAVQAAVNEADRRRIAAVAALKEPRETEAETLAAATAEYTMYLGFVGLTIPFAFGMAALITGHLDDSWLRAVRRWTMFSWFFLSLGLTLRMIWAYEELG